MKTALIVIDVQPCFLTDTTANLPEKIINHIKNHDYDELLFTSFVNIDNSNYEKTLHWSLCKKPEDTKIALPLDNLCNDNNTFKKHTYSAFKNIEFKNYLESNAVEKVVLCGLDLEGCVLATAFEAFDRGYEVEIILELSPSRLYLDDALKSIIISTLQTKNI